MKQKTIILTIFICMIMILCCGLASGAQVQASEIPVAEQMEDNLDVMKIESFTDANLSNYTMEELQEKITFQLNKQEAAKMIAASAIQLGWSLDSDAMLCAQIEFENAQIIIDTYQARYDELVAEQEAARWAAKMQEYPSATAIWLFMKELGWNDYVCAGIMGNMMTEVGGQTLNLKISAKTNSYYGICQWNRAYKEIWGADLLTQCNFLNETIAYELNTFGGVYKKGFNLDSFLALTNERDAALAFAKCYERCSSRGYGARQDNAEKAYDYFVNN